MDIRVVYGPGAELAASRRAQTLKAALESGVFNAEDNHVELMEVPSSARTPLGLFRFLRRAKKTMILYWIADSQTSGHLPRWVPSWVLLAAIRTVIKKPGGPAIAIESAGEGSALSRLADVSTSAERLRTPDEVICLLKEAYFAAECGHPAIIYKEPLQRQRIDWLREQGRGAKVLEIGCSTGFVLDYVGGGVGIDVDDVRLEYARTKYPHSKFVRGDAAAMPFKDREFDVVMIPDILEHVPMDHASRIVREASRVGKRLIITVPNAGKPNYDKTLVENPEHKWFPTESLVREMLGSAAKISYSPQSDFIYAVKEGA